MPSPRKTIKKNTRRANARRYPSATPKKPRRPPKVKAQPKEIKAPTFGKVIKAKAIKFTKRGGQILAHIWS